MLEYQLVTQNTSLNVLQNGIIEHWRAEHSLSYSDVTIYVFDTCIEFYGLSTWGGCWFVFLFKDVNLQILKCVITTDCCREWEGWARKPVNHTSLVAVVSPTDRPKSVRNRCVIELFCGVVCVVILPFWHFCWCRGVGLSQISSSFYWNPLWRIMSCSKVFCSKVKFTIVY